MRIFGHTLTRRGDALVLTFAILSGLVAGITINHIEKGLTHVQAHLPHVRNVQRSADRIRTTSSTVRPRATVRPAHRNTAPVPRHVAASRSEQRRAIVGLNHTQFTCLDKLWTRESRWNPKARNPHSTAAGIPQLLGLDTRLPAATQMRLGMRYIQHRYGMPCNALSHHNHTGWY